MNSVEAKLAVLMSNRWWDHLEPFCDQALAADPDSSMARAAKGFVLLRKDNLPAARQAFLDALQADPDDALPKCGLYFWCCRSGDFEQAEQYLRELLAEYPESESVHVANCWFHAKSRIRNKAEPAIAAALQLFPANEEVLGARLYHARRHSPDRDVRSLALSLLALYPENAFAHLCLGEQCLKYNDLAGAHNHFQTCMTVAPSAHTARMLKFVEVRRTGRGGLPLALWAIKRKLLKLLVPGYSQRERTRIDWDR